MEFSGDCATERAGPRGGRLDLHITSHDPRQPQFSLESKVAAKLQKTQLRRYKVKAGTKPTFLIAITRNRPEVPKAELQADGIHALRWQDIHRALAKGSVRSALDKFIRESFADYLEESNMAYRERLTPDDLKHAGRLIRSVHRASEGGIATKRGFDALHSCACVVNDICKDLRDEFPKLSRLKRWGPGYFGWRDDDDELIGHGLGIALWRGQGKKERNVGCYFSFGIDETEPTVWTVAATLPKSFRAVDTNISRFFTAGVLDSDKLLRSAKRQLQAWSLI